GASQQALDLLDLAALALPSHPHALARVPLPDAVEEEEAVLVLGGVAEVELLDAGASLLEEAGVVRHLGSGGVLEVAEDGEVDVGVHVAERLHLEVLDELPDALAADLQRGDDDHRQG